MYAAMSLKCQGRISHPDGRLVGPLEDESGVLTGGEWHTKLEQLDKNLGEVVEELLLALRVLLNDRLKALVLNEGHVGRQHHQALSADVLELLWALPLPPAPLLLEQELVVVVGEGSRRE